MIPIAIGSYEEQKRFIERNTGFLHEYPQLNELSKKVFLDLHTLFEAGGNNPASRERVLDVVTRLADAGYLESRGSDFYLLTDKGRRAVR